MSIEKRIGKIEVRIGNWNGCADCRDVIEATIITFADLALAAEGKVPAECESCGRALIRNDGRMDELVEAAGATTLR